MLPAMEPRAISTAFWGFIGPMTASRSLKIVVVSSVGILGLVLLVFFMGWIEKEDIDNLRALAVVPGIPLAAAILSEMTLRDGITHRTLLYPLLGPVPRPVLAIVRTLATGSLLAIFSAVALLFLHVLSGRGWNELGQEAAAALLGSLAYVSIFGLIHLISKRGFIICIALYGIFDHAIGMLPFAMSSIAPSHHLRFLGAAEETFGIPVVIDMPDPTLPGSILFLTATIAIAISATAFIFSRKSLAELC